MPAQSPPQRTFTRVILLATALMAAGAGYVGYVLGPRWPDPASSGTQPPPPIVINGIVFNVPVTAIRVPMQRRVGPHDRIDLAFTWPHLGRRMRSKSLRSIGRQTGSIGCLSPSQPWTTCSARPNA